jgi:transcriptional regulator with GAF, ATPase, and Fis domain
VNGRSKASAVAVRGGIVALALVLLALEVAAGWHVWQSVGDAFPGFAVYGSLTVDQLNQPYWTGVKAGLRPGDRVLAVEGEPLRSPEALAERVAGLPEGTRLHYTVSRRGQILDLPIRTMTYSYADFVNSFAGLALTALVFVFGGAAVAWFRTDAFGLGIYAFSVVVAGALGAGIEIEGADPFASEGTLTIPLATAALFHLVMVFPEPMPFVRRRGAWALAPYVALSPIILLRMLSAWRGGSGFVVVDSLYRWLPFVAAFGLPLAILRVRQFGSSEIARRRARVVFWGAAVAVACYAFGFVATELGWMPPAPTSTFILPAWIWLVTLAVGSSRHDVFGLGPQARAQLARATAFAITVTLYVVIFGVAALLLRPSIEAAEPWIPIVALLAGVLVYEPLRWIARSVLGGRRAGDASRSRGLREVSAELASSLDSRAIEAVVQSTPERLGLSRVRLFLEQGGTWRSAPGGAPVEDAKPLARALDRRRTFLSFESLNDLGSEEEAEYCRRILDVLGLSLVLPLWSRDQLVGMLGCRADPAGGALVSASDLTLLAALADHTAVALENARAFERIRELEQRLSAENVVLKEELLTQPGIGGLVGQSAAIQRVFTWVAQVAPTSATILLRGETGTGKELVARAIHAASGRRDRPMIRVNCAAVPAPLLESEFFGHERGAFTGATARKIGRFELAEGGTIFLDEIGDLPTELQPKLLRVLQDRQFERVGGMASVRVDVRVIAATNRDLESLVRHGRFREDLFFRLNVLPLVVPPLRDRREDIPALVAHFLQRYATKMQKPVRGVEERTLRALESYRWPGNVRELENVIERAVVVASGEDVVIRDLGIPRVDAEGSDIRPLAEQLRDVKIRTICRALLQTEGNQTRAAALLGLQPSSLSRTMKHLGIREGQWRHPPESGGTPISAAR